MPLNPGVIFVSVMAVLAAVTFLMMLVYKGAIYLSDRRAMSSTKRPKYYIDDFDNEKEAISAPETNYEIAETSHPNAETLQETFTLGETEALARLVASGKLGLTDAVKLGADAKSGEKYQRRSREIKARAAELQDKYPQRTPEQDQRRAELGLTGSKPRRAA